MIILGVDPGKATGVAMWDPASGFHQTWVADPAQYADWVWESLHEIPGDLIVACERFTISERTIRTARGDEPWSIELTGVTRHAARRRGAPFYLQDPWPAKTFTPNARLKEIGWHVPGPDHQDDALRHVILCAVERLGILPPWLHTRP